MFNGSDLGKGPEVITSCVFFVFVVCVPLALWKITDILFWLWSHVHVSWET